MKLSKSFASFLNNHVNLNQTRVDKANDTFNTLTGFLENADGTSAMFIDTTRQGSLRQGTIIKPRVDDTEFDVDLLLRLAPQDGWRPVDYLDGVRQVFESSDRYRDMVANDPNIHRCITIDYVGDFHVDVVPSIEVDGDCFIMNSDTDQFEATDGDGYARWFEGRNARTGGHLVRVVRLMKYLRDEHEWNVKSILLTTLLGERVQNDDTTARFSDIPTSFLLLVDRLDLWLQAQATMPTVVNPALPTEEFVRHWNSETFNKFKNDIAEVASKVRTAYASTDADKSAELWQQVFGEKFAVLDEDLEGGEQVERASLVLGSTAHVEPLSKIAPSGERLTNTARIDAAVYNASGRIRFRGINSDSKVSSGRAILFKVTTNAAEPYDVYWQVVNTGPHAAREHGLRGTFFKGKSLQNTLVNKHNNWEATQYTGRHWIEAFIVKNGVCVARNRFYVPVKNPLF
jgi:hypothetical protein